MHMLSVGVNDDVERTGAIKSTKQEDLTAN